MTESTAAREKRLARMREYNKTYKRKTPSRFDPEKKRAYMKEYLAKYHRRRKAANPEEFRKKHREDAQKWRDKNPEASRACYARWRAKNPDATRKACFKIEVRIARNIRCRVWYALKFGRKAGSAVRDLGCSLDFFKRHIESMFLAGMTWENYGKWHLDHIVPISSFNLQDREHFLKACHYTNYQPLWAIDNLKKGSKAQPLGAPPPQQMMPAA